MTICNMMVETGAKCTIMPFDRITQSFLAGIQSKGFTPVAADRGADYEEKFSVDLLQIVQQDIIHRCRTGPQMLRAVYQFYLWEMPVYVITNKRTVCINGNHRNKRAF